jgi:hypothetical protein
VAKKTKAARKRTASSRGARKGARKRATGATTAARTGLERYPRKIVFTPIKKLISSHIAKLKRAPQTDDVQKAMKILSDTKTQLGELCRFSSMALNFK